MMKHCKGLLREKEKQWQGHEECNFRDVSRKMRKIGVCGDEWRAIKKREKNKERHKRKKVQNELGNR